MEYGVLSLIIPLLTIVLAIITKDVIVSLLGGTFAGFMVLHHYSIPEAFIGVFDGLIGLFAQGWIVKTLLFMMLIGAIIRLLTISGAVESFVAYLSQRAKRIDSPKGVMLLAYTIGVVIFIESSITALVAGTVAKPLFDKHGISREKLAYICDASSSPICTLIPLNAWGALLLGLIVTAIESKVIVGDGVSLLIEAIAFNFYSIFTLIILLATILWQWDIGAMKRAKAVPYKTSTEITKSSATPFKMLLPLVVMILTVPLGLYLTGDGDIFKGSGSTSVYYAVVVTLFFIYGYFVPTKALTHKKFFEGLYEGMAHMLPVTVILLFALLIGEVIGELGTASYLATALQGNISAVLMPLLIFLVSALTAFSTGTSWGTFTIMMPIGLALGASMELHLPLVIGAVISGGIFGDHASPISDTTIISSMAADCDHVAHVRTQLPYALLGALLASVGFLIFGWTTL